MSDSAIRIQPCEDALGRATIHERLSQVEASGVLAATYPPARSALISAWKQSHLQHIVDLEA